ncbi:MAG: sigma 54-interacting transcriptional regulator, partial [Oscillospiraceae bacterium]
IRRLGDDRVVPVDVRVVSATNIDIGQQIGEGQFRADLYYRLNLLNLTIPPLRERDEDVPVMLSYFLSKFCCDYAKPVPQLTPEALSLLRAYAWPGNVRELRNLCERLAVLSDSPKVTRELILELGLLSAEFVQRRTARAEAGEPDAELLRQLTRPRINQTELARRLGISRTTLWRRMSKNCQNNNE